MASALEQFASVHQQLLDDRPQRQRREEGQRAHDQDDADEQTGKERRRGGEGTGASGTIFFLTREPASAITGIRKMKRPMSIANTPVQL